MRVPAAPTCEIESGSGWTVIGIDDALSLREGQVRPGFWSIECHQAVRPHKRGTTGQAAHFEHSDRNAKCSLSTHS